MVPGSKSTNLWQHTCIDILKSHISKENHKLQTPEVRTVQKCIIGCALIFTLLVSHDFLSS